jgi:DNA end-binding protein Ku
LRYDYEVRKEKDFFAHIPSPRVSKDMIELASHILQRKATKFDPEKFEDDYEKALRKLVQWKAKGHAIEAPAVPDRPDNVVNLLDALRESIKRGGRGRSGEPRRRVRKQNAEAQGSLVASLPTAPNSTQTLRPQSR